MRVRRYEPNLGLSRSKERKQRRSWVEPKYVKSTELRDQQVDEGQNTPSV